MVTIKQAWVGFVLLILVMLLVIFAMVYWQHVTSTNILPLLGAQVPVGC